MTWDVICFGSNILGQLSSSHFTSIRKTLQLPIQISIEYVTFSWSKCFIILSDSTLITRGLIDEKLCHYNAERLPIIGRVKKLNICADFRLVLTEEGDCFKCTDKSCENINNLLRTISGDSEITIIDICSSETIHLALTDTGRIYNIPLPIETSFSQKVTKISCGLEHCLCLTDNGSIYSWGNGSRGQLGNGCLTVIENPELVVCLDGIMTVDLDAGGWHSVALTVDGDVYAWGWNIFGQLAMPTNKEMLSDEKVTYSVLVEPKCIDYLEEVSSSQAVQISCGTQHTLILLKDGSVYGCGWNKYGQIDPSSSNEYFDRLTLVNLPNVKNISKISCKTWNSSLFVTVNED